MNLGPQENEPLQKCPLECGEKVPSSGIYEACHLDGRAESLLLFRDQTFPPCECCDTKVRYRLLRSVPYIFEDEDFRPAP